MRRTLRAYPALLRLGFAEAIAYRAEFLVWMLTTTLPLVMLALWSAVAADTPPGSDDAFSRFGQDGFVAYYLGALIIRQLTGSWVVWEMNQEIRTGTLSMRLLRPIHPFAAYSAEHLAAVPLRAALAVPVATIMLVATHGSQVVRDPVQIALLPLVIAGAWLITFLAMTIIGSLSLFMEQTAALFEIWLGLFAVMSGYLVPLAFMPDWLVGAARVLPFRYMLGYPVELLIGHLTRAEALELLAVQWAFVAGLLVLAIVVWRAGLRRYEAYGA